MSPRNLCNRLLHKFLVRVSKCKFCHILQVPNGITGSVRKSKFDIGRKAFNEFAAPGLMCIDCIADRMIEKQKLPVDTDRCAILRRANFLLDGFNSIQIFAGIQEHFAGPLRKNSIPIVTRERGKSALQNSFLKILNRRQLLFKLFRQAACDTVCADSDGFAHIFKGVLCNQIVFAFAEKKADGRVILLFFQ